MKGVRKIPLRQFNSDPQATGSLNFHQGQTTPQRSLTPRQPYPPSQKPECTAHHAEAGTQSERTMNSNTKRNDQASCSRPRCTSSQRRSPPSHRDRTSTRPSRTGRSPRGSSPRRERSLPRANNNNSRHREKGARDERSRILF